MTRLRICDSCSRHVLASEASCPFCQRALATAQLPAAPNAAPGLSRAQRLALAAAAVAGQALTACSGDASQPESPPIGTPVYGAPVSGAPATGGNGAGGKGAGGAGVAVPVYGAPVAGASGSGGARADANDPDDAGVAPNPPARDGGTMVHPLYGAPVPVYGAPLPQK